MKKHIIITLIIIESIVIAIILIYFLLSYNENSNAKAVISDDYLTISYDGQIYKSYIMDETTLPEFLNVRVNATVENRSFLWDCFLTDYIFVSNNGEYIHLITDYDDNISDYYKLNQ